MRRKSKIDTNQPAIVAALRAHGASVKSLAAVGDGCPDLLVGYRGINLLMEVKDGDLPPSARKLTDKQTQFISDWEGQICVVTSDAEAVYRLIAVDYTGTFDKMPFRDRK
jgi:hypothetical protein